MRRLVLLTLAVGWVALLPTRSRADAAPGPVKAVLELDQSFYYVGDPFNVRVSINNGGDSEVANPVKGALFGGFVLEGADRKRIEPSGAPSASEPARPAKLASKAFYGTVVDMTKVYPQLKSAGTYTIRWEADGVKSQVIDFKIIPRFDPSKEYEAVVDTEEGSFVINLLKARSPIAVKAFVDMAHAGFYDGLVFHEVRADQAVSGGDPTGNGDGQASFRYPAELAAIPVIAGTVILKPAGFAPPANSSQFVIALRPEPRWTGQFTVLGQVSEGLDVVKKISNVQSSDKPSYRPLKDVHTLRVQIREKATSPPPAAGS